MLDAIIAARIFGVSLAAIALCGLWANCLWMGITAITDNADLKWWGITFFCLVLALALIVPTLVNWECLWVWMMNMDCHNCGFPWQKGADCQ